MKALVTARDRQFSFECEPGEKILHAGLRSGVPLPYECATGTCGTCRARLLEGDVHTEWPDAPGQAGLRREIGELLMCQCVARGDVALELATAVKPMPAAACLPAAVAAIIRGTTRLTHDVVSLDLEPARPLRFAAGQFMLMTVPGITGARAYSMVNWAPVCDRLHFVIKKKPEGGLSEWLFARDVRGTRVDLFGPLGAATFEPGAGRHILCIAGGSGIAGMMAILSRAGQERYFDGHAGHVFFGVRTPRDVFFIDELSAAEAAAGGALEVTIALSDEDVDASLAARYPRLAFARGFVHRVAGDRMKGRYDNVRAYAAGPPVMVNAALKVLLVEGRLGPGDIRYDKFN
jgi:toluene monooxygenase electron transfer component